MEPVITTQPERIVIGMGAPFVSILSPDANNFIVIPELWHRFINRIGEIHNRASEATLGLCFGLPESLVRTHDDELFYVAGVQVSSADDVPEGMKAYTIPAATFAAITHKGTLDTLDETIGEMYEEWLPSSGKTRRDDVPDVEVYDERFDPTSDESEFEIHVPIG